MKPFLSFVLFVLACACVPADALAAPLSEEELEFLQIEAWRGDADALFALGEMHEKGESGFKADKMVALCCYLPAARKGHKGAIARVKALGGNRYLPEKFRDKGFAASAKTFFAGCGNGVQMEFVRIPAGTFMMGSPTSEVGRDNDESQVRVTISRPFYLGKYEVTQKQWRAVRGTDPSKFKGDDCPVECVSWDDANAFCAKLTERERDAGRLPQNMKYTLPTEAQWEYACRAGTTTRFSFGNSASDLCRYGNFYDKSGDRKYDADYRKKNNWKLPPDTAWDDGYVETAPVGRYRPNAWGLYDMHGNVWEWCADYYNPELTAGTDPCRTTPGSGEYGSRRVGRGGGWSGPGRDCRSAIRGCSSPGIRNGDLGFRVCAVQER